jgi:very-short-patch-repair endonuclease
MPLDDPSALPRVLGRRQALGLGFSRRAIDHRVATGRWRRILPRTYLTVDTLTWTDRQTAALTFAGPDALLTGAAALADDGLRCVQRPPTLLVLVPYHQGTRSTGFVRVRRVERMPPRALLPGPARVTPARAVTDLALAAARLDDVRTLVSEAVRKRLCQVEELAAEHAVAPRRGSAFLRQAIDEVGAGAWSAPEARAGSLLRSAGVPRFEQNHPILLPSGRRLIVDFCWPELRAVLEIDSWEFHADAPQRERDDSRHIELETLGFSVIHRTPRFVLKEPRRFVDGVVAWLEARRAALGR